MSTPPPRILLVEPQYVLRRTIVMVARDLGAVDFQEVSNIGQARALLEGEAYDGLVVDLLEGAPAITLLKDLRQGKFASQANARVIVVGSALGEEDEQQLRSLAVDGVLHKPFKIGDLLNAVTAAGKAIVPQNDADLMKA